MIAAKCKIFIKLPTHKIKSFYGLERKGGGGAKYSKNHKKTLFWNTVYVLSPPICLTRKFRKSLKALGAHSNHLDLSEPTDELRDILAN